MVDNITNISSKIIAQNSRGCTRLHNGLRNVNYALNSAHVCEVSSDIFGLSVTPFPEKLWIFSRSKSISKLSNFATFRKLYRTVRSSPELKLYTKSCEILWTFQQSIWFYSNPISQFPLLWFTHETFQTMWILCFELVHFCEEKKSVHPPFLFFVSFSSFWFWFWALGPLGTWAFGHLGTWAFGHLGLWALGPLGTWAFVQNSLECPEWLGMARNGPEWPRKARNGPEWPEMARNGPE